MLEQGLIGKQIGQYKIESQIGQGGMATVYKAYQPSINRHVAIKILPGQYAQDPNFVKRFEHEAKAIAALEHPHILPIFDFGTQDGLTYMAMRYVETGTLSNLMGRPLSYERIVRLIGPVARALDYAHKQGVVHRDIKPSNILIDKNGEPLLTDFGIAKMVQGSGGATQLTGTGMVLGTPAYMSPEQAKGTSLDGRSDIYSLGVVLYELLTGQQPYQAETPLAVVFKHVSEPLPPPRTVNPNVPEPLERVVIKAMAKDPAQRYQTAGEMENGLQAALREIETSQRTVSTPALPTPPQGVPTSPPTSPPSLPTTPGPSPSKSRRKMGLWLGAGAAVLCLGGCGLLALGMYSAGDITATPTRVAAATPTRKPVSIGVEKTATPTPTVESTATPEPTAAAATDTSTPESTAADNQTAYPDNLPSGDILFQEKFDNNRNDWPTGKQEDEYGISNSEFVDGRYQMSQKAKQGVFTWNTLNETDFDDFAFSMEATPIKYNKVFAYGMTFREDADFGDLYVFEIDTDGYYSVSLRKDGEWETLEKWAELAAINKEGPNELMVKTAGPVLRFYVNGTEAASLYNDSLSGGSIGLALDMFEAGDEATAEFDNVVVRALSAEEQTELEGLASSLGPQDETPQVEVPGLSLLDEFFFEDTFDSDASGWATGKFKDDYSENEVKIADGKYSLTVKDKDQAFVSKVLPNREFSNFILEVEATPRDTGTGYSYGVSFREEGDVFYAFEIGNDGQFAVLFFDGEEWKRLKDWSTSEAIKVADTNKISIIAQDKSLTFLVNDELLTTLSDGSSPSGKIGLVIAMFEKGASAAVDFDNLSITSTGQ
jgi:serine/threonine protein kinase